jgi:hypothetical protein
MSQPNNHKLYHNEDAYSDLSIDKEIFSSLDRTITKIGKEKLRNRHKYCSVDTNYLEALSLKNFAIYEDL